MKHFNTALKRHPLTLNDDDHGYATPYCNDYLDALADHITRLEERCQALEAKAPLEIKIKKVRPDVTLPTQGSSAAAGFDLYASLKEPQIVMQHGTEMIGTGIAVAIPEGYFGALYARSGLASKEGLRPANCVGVIDPDYRGEIKVALHNDSDKIRIVDPNERIAQLVIQKLNAVTFVPVEELDETKRGTGGFGHSGK